MSFIETKGRILESAERLDPSKTALLVVDVQNDFCHPSGVFGRIGHNTSMMQKMAENLLQEGVYVVGFSYPVVPVGMARIRTQMSAALKTQREALFQCAFSSHQGSFGTSRTIRS